jgi:hypothetical protein
MQADYPLQSTCTFGRLTPDYIVAQSLLAAHPHVGHFPPIAFHTSQHLAPAIKGIILPAVQAFKP